MSTAENCPTAQSDYKAFFITLSPVVRSLDRDQRNRQQGREDAQRFPAGKAFVEDHSGKNNRDHRIEGTQHDGRVQATGLLSSDEERSTTDVETSSEQCEGGAGRLR